VLSTAAKHNRLDSIVVSSPPFGKADANSDTPTTTLILIPRVFQSAMITREMDDSYFYQQLFNNPSSAEYRRTEV
jgi:hypothetical protein